MPYRIKAFLIADNKIDCRFECVLNDFTDVIEFLSKVSLEAYDVIKVLPEGMEK